MRLMTGEALLPSGFHLLALDSIDSTNEEAKRLAESGAPEGTVVWAKEQTAVKGRRGRTWVTTRGNLAFSILLRPDYPAAEALQVGFVAANGIALAVAEVLPRSAAVTCKWPNDVLVEGRKVSGLLLESATTAAGRLDWLVVGVGLNVAGYPANTEFPATSLAAAGAHGVTVVGMLESICGHFHSGLAGWRDMGFYPVREAWLERAHGLGEPVTVRLEKETLTGEFRTLDEQGALVLGLNGDERRITAGDVFPGVR